MDSFIMLTFIYEIQRSTFVYYQKFFFIKFSLGTWRKLFDFDADSLRQESSSKLLFAIFNFLLIKNRLFINI